MTHKIRKSSKSARSAAHQAAVLGRRTSNAAGAHRRRTVRGAAKRSAIADQTRER